MNCYLPIDEVQGSICEEMYSSNSATGIPREWIIPVIFRYLIVCLRNRRLGVYSQSSNRVRLSLENERSKPIGISKSL